MKPHKKRKPHHLKNLNHAKKRRFQIAFLTHEAFPYSHALKSGKAAKATVRTPAHPSRRAAGDSRGTVRHAGGVRGGHSWRQCRSSRGQLWHHQAGPQGTWLWGVSPPQPLSACELRPHSCLQSAGQHKMDSLKRVWASEEYQKNKNVVGVSHRQQRSIFRTPFYDDPQFYHLLRIIIAACKRISLELLFREMWEIVSCSVSVDPVMFSASF